MRIEGGTVLFADSSDGGPAGAASSGSTPDRRDRPGVRGVRLRLEAPVAAGRRPAPEWEHPDHGLPEQPRRRDRPQRLGTPAGIPGRGGRGCSGARPGLPPGKWELRRRGVRRGAVWPIVGGAVDVHPRRRGRLRRRLLGRPRVPLLVGPFEILVAVVGLAGMVGLVREWWRARGYPLRRRGPPARRRPVTGGRPTHRARPLTPSLSAWWWQRPVWPQGWKRNF
jgi:hypothetical protein